MRNVKVFGEVPENFKKFESVKFTPVARWNFIDNCEHASEIVDDEAASFMAQVPAEDLEEFQKEMYIVEDEEETVAFEMPLIQLNEGRSTGVAGRFGTRQHALSKLGIDVDPDAGDDIGVVVLDAGINRDYIESIAGPGRYGGGWTNQPPATSNVGRFVDPNMRAADVHGNMIVRNILSIAPKATVYDAAILPPKVYSLPDFSADVVGALRAIHRVIKNRAGNPRFPQHKHWILVNAWAVATSFAATGQPRSYVDNRDNRINKNIIRLAELDNVDVVFAAGNAGIFQPDPFSGPYDRGHGRSIWGANGLEEVFTIGAIRTDGISIGKSSQGPSFTSLTASGTGANQKPDLCTPSWFGENYDPSILNTGTSASCGVFAGVLAQVRTATPGTASASVKADIISNARGDGEWRAQTGYGVPA